MLFLGQSSQLSNILFLEDDLLFGESLVDLLEEYNYEVTHVKNSHDALDMTYKQKFDLYLLDINVPLINGITLLKELRASQDKTPAIFLTSHKEKEMLIEGFNSGADDFITKPFDNDELLLRLNAIVQRNKPKNVECLGLLCHDEQYKRISYDKQDLDLSKKEYLLLLLLMRHVNKPVSKELMQDELWSNADVGSYGAIRVYINRIKQVLPNINIENIRGFGYRLVY
jgi:DNA-binding response OmpR family regulator